VTDSVPSRKPAIPKAAKSKARPSFGTFSSQQKTVTPSPGPMKPAPIQPSPCEYIEDMNAAEWDEVPVKRKNMKVAPSRASTSKPAVPNVSSQTKFAVLGEVNSDDEEIVPPVVEPKKDIKVLVTKVSHNLASPRTMY